MIAAALTLFAYLMGSLSSAIIVARAMGLPDPRTQGSRNPGATNVLRYGGKRAAAITLGGDVLKGLIPVLVAQWVGAGDRTLAAVSLAAFLGHLYPVFFGLRGGKGVATALGVLLGVSWPVGVAAAATWLGMALLFRISSLAALTAALLAPLYLWWWRPSGALLIAVVVMSALLFWRHRSNIQNLAHGTEDKIRLKSVDD